MSEVDNVDNASATEAAPVAEAAPAAEAPAPITMDGLLQVLDEDVRGAKTWEKYKDVQSFMKSHLDLDRFVGRRGDIPQEDATDDERNAFWSKLGRPDDATGYEYNVPEGMNLGDGYLDKVSEAAHKYNIPKAAAEGLVNDMLAYEAELGVNAVQAEESSREQDLEVLESEWGESFDEMKIAVRGIEQKYGLTPEQAESIESNPAALILLGKIANDLGEKSQVGNAFSRTQAGIASQIEDAAAEISRLMVEGAPAHRIDAAQEKWRKLNELGKSW